MLRLRGLISNRIPKDSFFHNSYMENMFREFCCDPESGSREMVENMLTIAHYLNHNPLPGEVYKQASDLPTSVRRLVRFLEVEFKTIETLADIACGMKENFWPELVRYEVVVDRSDLSYFSGCNYIRTGETYRVFLTKDQMRDLICKNEKIKGYRLLFAERLASSLDGTDGNI